MQQEPSQTRRQYLQRRVVHGRKACGQEVNGHGSCFILETDRLHLVDFQCNRRRADPETAGRRAQFRAHKLPVRPRVVEHHRVPPVRERPIETNRDRRAVRTGHADAFRRGPHRATKNKSKRPRGRHSILKWDFRVRRNRIKNDEPPCKKSFYTKVRQLLSKTFILKKGISNFFYFQITS